MRCKFGNHDTQGLIHLSVYTKKGILVCADCYELINRHRHQPYSKVMDKVALLEAGYQVNRKRAEIARLIRLEKGYRAKIKYKAT